MLNQANNRVTVAEWGLIILVLGVMGLMFLISFFEDSHAMALLRSYLNNFITTF